MREHRLADSGALVALHAILLLRPQNYWRALRNSFILSQLNNDAAMQH
jgi:hypothetical protein